MVSGRLWLPTERSKTAMSDIAYKQADAIVRGALDAAHHEGSKPLAVVVLDRAGHVVAAAREDGATMFRYDIALGKAWSAVAFQTSSRALADKAAQNANFMLSLSGTSQGRLLPNPGGLPILNEDAVVIGAVGISGDSGQRDESFAAAGIESVGLSHVLPDK